MEYYGRSVNDRPLLSNGSCRRAVGLWLGPIRGTEYSPWCAVSLYSVAHLCVGCQVSEKGGGQKLLFSVHAVTHLAGVKFQQQPTPKSPLVAASGMGTMAASLTSRLGARWSSARLAVSVSRSQRWDALIAMFTFSHCLVIPPPSARREGHGPLLRDFSKPTTCA